MDTEIPGKSILVYFSVVAQRWWLCCPSSCHQAARPLPGRRGPRALVSVGLCRLDSGAMSGQERGKWARLPQIGALRRGRAPALQPR